MPVLMYVSVLILILVLAVVYMAYLRPWQLRWGATDDEIRRVMPGDEVVVSPTFNATRAVTINAPAENIYPWIVQMGMTRAGWYSYDLLDNLARPSAETILPQFQDVCIGSLIPLSPDGKQGMWVKDFHVNQWMLWWDKAGDSTWAWEIVEDGENRSRLITRVRVKYIWFSPSIVFSLLIEFCDIVMMRKCMLGIQRRAQAMTASKPQPVSGVLHEEG